MSLMGVFACALLAVGAAGLLIFVLLCLGVASIQDGQDRWQ